MELIDPAAVETTEVCRRKVDGNRSLGALANPPAGFAWAYTITFDGDTHWLECDHCAEPVKPVEAGDSLESIVTRALDHERSCLQ